MKKTLAALLLAIFALGFAACGVPAVTEETTTEATTEVITADETTALTTAEETTVFETAEETTAEPTVEVTTEITTVVITEATTEATTVATTVATTEATTVATTEVTTEATTVITTEATTVTEETSAPEVPEEFSFEKSDLSEYVLLGKYLGIEVFISAPAPVSEAEIDEQVNSVIESLPPEAMVYGRACEVGDKINIDFVGTMDGVAFDGGSAQAQMLVLGEGRFIPGFEEGIVGMIPGDVRPINVVFPDDYYEELAGKTAQFDITLNYIYPTLTDEMASEFFGYENVEAVRADIRASLEAEARKAQNSEKEEAAWTKVLANSSVVVYPEEQIELAFQKQLDYYKGVAASYGMTYEELFTAGYGLPVEEAEKILYDSAKNSVKQQLVLYSIAREKEIPLDDAHYENELLALAAGYGLSSVDELLAAVGYTKAELKEIMIYSEVIEEIIANANFVELTD